MRHKKVTCYSFQCCPPYRLRFIPVKKKVTFLTLSTVHHSLGNSFIGLVIFLPTGIFPPCTSSGDTVAFDIDGSVVVEYSPSGDKYSTCTLLCVNRSMNKLHKRLPTPRKQYRKGGASNLKKGVN